MPTFMCMLKASMSVMTPEVIISVKHKTEGKEIYN